MIQKRVAIILLNWNSYEHTSNCIASLQLCTPQYFDIILVDNGSSDNSGLELHRQYPFVKYLPSLENRGFAGGNNLGFRYALAHQYEYVLMLNNDVFVDPNFLDELVNYLDAHPTVAAIQPKIFFNHDRTKLWNGGSYFLSWFGWTYSKKYMRSESVDQSNFQQVDWITGCALLTRTSILNELGLLNERFFIYYEDVDFSFRLRAAGYTLIFHPRSIIYHIAGMANKTPQKGKEGYVNPYMQYLNFRNHIWVLRSWIRWYQWPSSLVTLIVYSLAVMLYFAVRRRWTKLFYVSKGIYHGFFKHSK